ncbi:MAG: diphosphomevalonate decarboxylase [Saprospiraceae bacterium]|jgi:diphosphomevalonate decarboxylase|nr:diphosphomevalonate decarboxylase [Saprospiraceae bacterium]
MDYKNPKLVLESAKTEPGQVTWRSPSNLAIIKYWGKYGTQLPKNPSISFTLKNAYTETILAYAPKKSTELGISLQLYFNGEKNDSFRAKMLGYFESLVEVFPFLRQLDLTIHTTNSFPHSTGIASSASGMSAAALCLCALEKRFFDTLLKEADFYQKASFLSRLGSGSACRSVYPKMVLWGESREVADSSNEYAVPMAEHINPVFHTYHDDILIISKKEKSVSSRAGHQLMEGNIYAENRYAQARQRLNNLLHVLKTGEVDAFGAIAEAEALTLHALMMVSEPPYVLIKPNTLKAIEAIKNFRETTKQPLYFSLDAGPNLHLLYPDAIKKDVQHFIRGELSEYCEQQQWIEDEAGDGPVEID